MWVWDCVHPAGQGLPTFRGRCQRPTGWSDDLQTRHADKKGGKNVKRNCGDEPRHNRTPPKHKGHRPTDPHTQTQRTQRHRDTRTPKHRSTQTNQHKATAKRDPATETTKQANTHKQTSKHKAQAKSKANGWTTHGLPPMGGPSTRTTAMQTTRR